MRKYDLNRNWRLHEEPLKYDRTYLGEVERQTEGWLACDLPADVRMPLLEAGKIREPLISDWCRESEWIERRSWWFEKRFSGEAINFDDDIIELVLEGLDSLSDIFINGHYIGTHHSVHYPFTYDVKEYLTEGENVLTVRVTSGLEQVSEDDLAELDFACSLESNNGGKYRGDARRSFVRRPQYTVGWDWGPKVITVGITGGAFLRGFRKIAVREVSARTLQIGTGTSGEVARIGLMVNVENLSFIGTRSCDLQVVISHEGKRAACKELENVLLTSGFNYVDLELDIPDALLWWPNGYGDQPLYEISVNVSCEDVKEEWPVFRFGIRTLTVDTGVISGEDRRFRLVVNGQAIYCKGGNWIPNDFIYARVPDEKYRVLIREAVEANFNMIRVWGGGLYEREIFYDLCDRAGILLWHDFMFACSTYPDHREWFRDEMRKEFDYQTKRLRNHACLGLFCGTNEVHWIFNSIDNPRRNIEFTYEHQYGLWIANVLAKEIIRKNCPQIPYWNSSPYGGELPNADTVGDVHRWHNAFMSKKMEERIEAKDYDTIESKFVSEYGFVGPCCEETTRAYMGEESAEPDRESELWHMHCNVFEKGTVNEAIRKNYLDDPETLSLQDFILYGGMCHALMYGYSLESMRFKENCGGGLFWMYNDAWGEVGWTVIDYYLRRKIPFYAVKRALAHKKMTLRAVDGKAVLQGINDTPLPVQVSGRFGYVSFDGTVDHTEKVSFTLQPRTRKYLMEEALGDRDYRTGTIAFYSETPGIDSCLLRTADNRELVYEAMPAREVSRKEDGEDLLLTLRADGFAHGVYVKDELVCDDNYFDLLPGETKTVRVISGAGKAVSVGQVR